MVRAVSVQGRVSGFGFYGVFEDLSAWLRFVLRPIARDVRIFASGIGLRDYTQGLHRTDWVGTWRLCLASVDVLSEVSIHS